MIEIRWAPITRVPTRMRATVRSFLCPPSSFGLVKANNNRIGGRRHLGLSDRDCTCHIAPPCSTCVESVECTGCGYIEHEDDGAWAEGEFYCDVCIEQDEKHRRDAESCQFR